MRTFPETDIGNIFKILVCFDKIYTIMDEGISLSLDNGIHTETVVQLFKGNISNRNAKVEFSSEDMDIMKNPTGI